MWLVIAIAFVLFVLLLNGMIHQERFILWREHQVGLTERQKAEVELRKRAAKDRIKGMLRDVRRRTDDPATAPPGSPAASTAPSAAAPPRETAASH